MRKKAKAKAKAGSMPVLGNEESGVLARQSSNFSCVIPIKKRLSSMFYSGAPIRPDRSFSNENESKTKDSGLNSCDSKGKSDTPDNSLLEIKEERPLGAKVDDQPTMLPFLSISPETNPSTTCGPSRNVDDVVKPALAEKLADVDDAARMNRSNWDLNTPMESWKGFVDDVPVQDASQIDLLRKTSSSLDIKLPISSASVIGSNGDKGKQVVGASEQEFNFPISSIHPTVRHMSVDVLRHDLGSTLRGLDSSVLQSLGRNMNSSTVNSEPVIETLVQANAGTVVCPAGTFEANVVKTEVLKPNLQSIGLSTDGPPELLEQISMTSDVIAHQSVGRVLHLRESSSSSNGVDLSKNANFDLKESNVSSDKVEASVSANMNIEDHTVYKKTQDADNLVASGEKISISAGTEEEYYDFDYESNGTKDHAFTGHADREDEEYEDGEIREPMMQSIAEGMNSVHTVSSDDFVKCCDEKADKMNPRSPLLDKVEKTSDDEKRPIHAIRNETFSSNHRPVNGRSLSSRSGREKFYRPRNRDEISGYGPKFVRDRFPDRSFGSSRGGFMHGRGRHSGRFHRLGRDFECYGGVADYRFRHKRIAPWIDAAASNRRRKPINDALPSFWHAPARQLSPNGRKHAARMYDRPDGQFVQGNTKFTSMQRRGFPRMWSKSPVRSRTWSSPQRRLTEGFSGHRDSSQHRSPVMHREDRMRSSPQTPFTKEALAPQRCDSPSYTARHLNDMKDVDAVQEHVHPRSLASRRNPPDPVFTSANRSVEISDHRERADGESTDKTRMYGEKRGGPKQMRNVKEQEEEFDVSKLKKRRF